ncbi:MAG: DNA repair protein RecO [Rhodospirillales bacterium]|nr:DNA repair protein RecO [Alphaproteobacteria bacterium]MCB9986103.1 DNA repair protein RecO [Rhodospirillales bacterium]USO08628.1 MAG: DNA repair protein RecO [Rhodospirillales bacterium]
MEKWGDQGIVLASRPHGEGAAVVTLLTARHGRHAGYVHGGATSQRLRAALQPGTRIDLDWHAQSMDQLGSFAVTDAAPPPPAAFDDPAGLCALQSVCAILDRALPEREPHPALFAGTCAWLDALAQERAVWAAALVFWELALLRELGFGLDLTKCVVTNGRDDLAYVSPKSGGAVSRAGAGEYRDRLLRLPSFLHGAGDLPDNADIRDGLKLAGHFLEHRLFAHTTCALPDARLRLPEFFA